MKKNLRCNWGPCWPSPSNFKCWKLFSDHWKSRNLSYNLGLNSNPSCNSSFFQPWLNNFWHQQLFKCGKKLKTWVAIRVFSNLGQTTFDTKSCLDVVKKSKTQTIIQIQFQLELQIEIFFHHWTIFDTEICSMME